MTIVEIRQGEYVQIDFTLHEESIYHSSRMVKIPLTIVSRKTEQIKRI